MTPKAWVYLCTHGPGCNYSFPHSKRCGGPWGRPWSHLQSSNMFVQKLPVCILHPLNCPTPLPAQSSSSQWLATAQSWQSEMVGICWKHSLLGSAHTPFVQSCCTACLGVFLQTCCHLIYLPQGEQPQCSWCNSPGKKPGWVQLDGIWDGGGWDTPSCRAVLWWKHRSRMTRDGWCVASTPPPGWTQTGSDLQHLTKWKKTVFQLCHGQTRTCLHARRSAAMPTSWKQSAATGVDARNLSTMFTARQQLSKDRWRYLCTGMSQLMSVQRASAVNYKTQNQNNYTEWYLHLMHSTTISFTYFSLTINILPQHIQKYLEMMRNLQSPQDSCSESVIKPFA